MTVPLALAIGVLIGVLIGVPIGVFLFSLFHFAAGDEQ